MAHRIKITPKLLDLPRHNKVQGSFESFVAFYIDIIEEWILEAKTDCYRKDRLFVTSFAFCVITFEPIMIYRISSYKARGY